MRLDMKNIFRSKKIRRCAVAALAFLLALCIMSVTAVLAISGSVVATTKSRMITVNESKTVYGIDCIIVLGAFVKENGQPSDMLKDRLDVALELYNAGVSERILVSGDHGREGYNEVGIMKKYLVDNGVPDSAVFMDHAGFSTYETMYRANEIFLTESYYKRVIIVTQEYHLYRAMYNAKNVGLDAYGVASDPREYSGQYKRDIREHLARFKDFFFCTYEASPTYHGDPISIYGDGNATNDEYYDDLFKKN